jgi:hypothetical protein
LYRIRVELPTVSICKLSLTVSPTGNVFRREWDSKTSSFRRTNNPDHEYSN